MPLPRKAAQDSHNRSSVVFAFDRNLLLQAEITFFSLLSNASPEKEFELFVLCNEADFDQSSRNRLTSLVESFGNASLIFLNVGDAFSGSFQIRGITVPTYYRLLLPDLLKDHDQILYLDVDIIVTRDLDRLVNLDLGNVPIAGVKGVYPNQDSDRLKSLGIKPGTYVNAGVLLMNLHQMRRENLQQRFLELAKQDFTFQDQDILNLTCRGRIHYLPPTYNLHAMFDFQKERDYADQLFGSSEVDEAIRDPALIHYAGNKPWNRPDCFYYDRWWEAYRKSPAFNESFYLDHQREIIHLLARDQKTDTPSPDSGLSGSWPDFKSRWKRRARRAISLWN